MENVVKISDLEHGEKFTDLFGKQWIRWKKTMDIVEEGDHVAYCINTKGEHTAYCWSANVIKGWE